MRARRFVLVVLLALALLPAPVAIADLGGFSIQQFDADINIHADASVVVNERIVVDFSAPRRGIYRTIPVRYTDPKGFRYSLGFRLLGVTDDSGNEHPIKVTSEGANKSIRIGRADVTRTGEVVYNIRYRLDDALRHFEEHDEFYWNVTGTQWDTRIEHASATVHLPGAVDERDLKRIGFTGAYGSTGSDLAWTTLDADRVRVEATRVLNPHEGLTIAVGWPHGLVEFPGPAARTVGFLARNVILLAPVIAFFGLLRRWRRVGRDPEGPGSVMVRYEPPADLRPGEIGTIVDERVDMRDLTATIVDLAVRGYLRIEVVEEKHLFGLSTSEEVIFHRSKPETRGELLDYEQRILDGVFHDGTDRMKADDLAQKFYKELPGIKSSLNGRLVANRYFEAEPAKVKGRYVLYGFAAGIAVGGLGFLIGSATGAAMPSAAILPVMTGVVTALIFFGFAPAMPCRTKRGVEARTWALGFEEFVDRVESDKLEMDRRRRVFEGLLPYAMALGVADKWARGFEGIYAAGHVPGWYTGASPLSAGFSTAAFHRSLQGSLKSASQSMAASPRSSGSSGLSGGGFSGGGGGGGGGGSW
jgi:uncharacterized membrane protein